MAVKRSIGIQLCHHLENNSWSQTVVHCSMYTGNFGNSFPVSRSTITEEDAKTIISELKLKNDLKTDKIERFCTSNVCKVNKFEMDAIKKMREKQLDTIKTDTQS